MTDFPTAALFICGTTDIRMHNAHLVGGILSDALKAAGMSVNARVSMRFTPSASYAAAIRSTLLHLSAVSDAVITVGAVGFGDGDILPDITNRLCTRRADCFTGVLCGAAAPPYLPETRHIPPKDALPPFIPAAERRAREKCLRAALSPLTVLSRLFTLPCIASFRPLPASPLPSAPPPRRVHPSRAAAGIRDRSLLLNFPDDCSDARLLIDALLPSVCYTVFRLCGKCAVPVTQCDDLVNTISSFCP